jgi:predicted aspartyl protease
VTKWGPTPTFLSMEKIGGVVFAIGILFSNLVLIQLLVGADSPAIESPPAQSATNPIVISFQIRRGHIMVPAQVDRTNSLSLLLDTGYGISMLSPQFIEAFGLKRTGKITIVGIAGEEPAGVFEGPTFDFGGATWKPRRVAAFPTDAQTRSRQRDGILGSAFFRRFVVEIDSVRKKILLHEPDTYRYDGTGEIIPIRFKSSTPIMDASVHLPDGTKVATAFEIDTGCDGALCIGKHFVQAHGLPETNNKNSTDRSGVGGSTRIRSGHLARLQIGKIKIEKPAADFFLEGSPVDAPLAGHIGWNLLREFKVIFDYKRKRIILE